MAFTETALGQVQLASASATTIYTVPSATKAIIRDIQLCNTTSSDVTVSLWIDQNGTSATDAEAIFKNFSILANEVIHWSGFKVMVADSTIKGQGSTNLAITATLDGAEIT